MEKFEFLNLEPKISYLGVLGTNFGEPLWYLKTSPSNLLHCKACGKNFVHGYFWARITKNYSHIWNQNPRICIIAKFYKDSKMSWFGSKNALFRYFEARTWKIYCHVWNQHPRICLIAKSCKKKKKFLILGPKMPYLGILKLEFF